MLTFGLSGRHASRFVLWTMLLFPTVLATIYFSLVAADQYESEARFIVKSVARRTMPAELSLLASLGFGRSQDDSYAVQDFVKSRDAIARLRPILPIDQMFRVRQADFLSRFPSVIYRDHEEEFYKYFQHMVSVVNSTTTGVTTLRVKAFNALDARAIAVGLLDQGEALVNRMNVRAMADAVRTAELDLNLAQRRLIDAQLALTAFRNHELVIDPVRNAATLGELIAQLSAELASVRATIKELSVGSSASPQIPGLRRKEAALEQQIGQERARVGQASDGLAGRIAEYERLTLERDFAERRVTSAEAELVRARDEALRQQLYLERVVEPNLPDYPTHPERIRWILIVLVANLLLLLVGWLVYSGVREHVAE